MILLLKMKSWITSLAPCKGQGYNIDMKKKIQKNQFKVGDVAYLPVGELMIEVKILELKSSYGRQRFSVKPVRGIGEMVVEKLTLKIAK